MKVTISNLAESKLIKLYNYLTENWNLQAKNNFHKKLIIKIEQIKTHPYSCIESSTYKGLYKCVVNKQTTFYYRVLKSE